MALSESAVEGSPETTAAELLARIEALVPFLADEAAEAERLRRPTDASIHALEDAGVFRMMVPRCYGGYELDLDTLLEVGLLLGEADISIAWVTNFCVEHNWMLCQFPETFQRELYRDASHVLAPGVIAPSGKAKAVAGGYRLSGRWQWGSGVMHSTWAIVGAALEEEGPAGFRFFALPIEDVSVDDVWHVDGMCGTGSNDIVIDDAFVPQDRCVSIFDLASGSAHGASLHAGPLYRTPMIPILMTAASTPVVGQARAVVRGLAERMQERTRFGATSKQAEKASAQIRLARATLEVRQAELLLRAVVGEVREMRAAAKPEDRARWSSSISHAVHQSRRVIADVAEISGGSAHFRSHPLQRSLRDANVAACHVAFDADAQLELYGRLLLGLEPNSAVF